MTCWRWSEWSALATCAPIRATSSVSSGVRSSRARSESPRMYSITMYGWWAEKSPEAMKSGTCEPWRVGMIICSTSKPTIAVGSSPSRSSGIFITSGGCPGAETRQSVAMLPWWMRSSSV